MLVPAILTVTELEACTAHRSNLDNVFRKCTPSSHLQRIERHPLYFTMPMLEGLKLSHPSSSMSMLPSTFL